jgi:hypothetical protein
MSTDQESSINLIGTWRLVELADLDPATNTWQYPYGEHPMGYATYSRSGVVTINISSQTPLNVPEESAESYSIVLSKYIAHYVGYFGTYVVNSKESTVTHVIHGSSIPWLAGSADPRPFTIKGDVLTLGDNKTWKRNFVRVD